MMAPAMPCKVGKLAQVMLVIDHAHSGSDVQQRQAGLCDRHPRLLVGRLVVVDHLHHGHRPIAHALDADERILPQHQPTIAVAVVQLVVGAHGEVAPAVFLDGVGAGTDHGVDGALVGGLGAGEIQPRPLQVDEVLLTHDVTSCRRSR